MVFDDFFRGSGVSIIAMHPGNVATQIGDDNDEKYLHYKKKHITPKTRSPEIAGTALYYLGISDEVKSKSGLFELYVEGDAFERGVINGKLTKELVLKILNEN